MSNKTAPLPSINYHFWWPCNMRCKFCFFTLQDFSPEFILKNTLKKEDSFKLIEIIAGAGFQKITFVGGEPTLCPYLVDLVKKAKKEGLTTMIVSNGSLLTDNYLDLFDDYLDWITLSIDSVDTAKLIKMGRAVGGKKAIFEEEYLQIIKSIKRHKIRLKINTVVNSMTWQDDMTEFILKAKPERWKIMQVLPIKGQNDYLVDQFLIKKEEFEHFSTNHERVKDKGIKIIIENNDLMLGSYMMIDPLGRFIENIKGSYHYSKPILEIGIKNALGQIQIIQKKFHQREGIYKW